MCQTYARLAPIPKVGGQSLQLKMRDNQICELLTPIKRGKDSGTVLCKTVQASQHCPKLGDNPPIKDHDGENKKEAMSLFRSTWKVIFFGEFFSNDNLGIRNRKMEWPLRRHRTNIQANWSLTGNY